MGRTERAKSLKKRQGKTGQGSRSKIKGEQYFWNRGMANGKCYKDVNLVESQTEQKSLWGNSWQS